MDERDTGEQGGGNNARPLDDSVAGTGPGIPDDARAPGEEIPAPPSDEDVARARRALGLDAAAPDDDARDAG